VTFASIFEGLVLHIKTLPSPLKIVRDQNPLEGFEIMPRGCSS